MLIHKVGDLLKNVRTGHILHGCNAQGVMGGGFAKAVRDTYPEAYRVYREEYVRNGLCLGQVIPVRVSDGGVDVVIWNCITQNNFGNDGSLYTNYNAVSKCTAEVNRRIDEFNVEKVANFPLIGAVLGGGKWPIIEDIIDDELDDFNQKILWTLTMEDYIKAKGE